ncbi:MAG: hypothetical protein KAI97_04230 [Gemmatimonadetes bacterium]|nr:hypothetical protein [Gemmatimonadota bacterium]
MRLFSGFLTAYFAFQIWKGLAWTVRTGRVEAIESLTVVVVIAIGVVIYLAPHASLIVGRRWPRARLVTVIALVILAGWSFATTGSVLGVPLILPTFLVAFVLMALLSVSYFLAAVIAVPG